MSVMLVEAGLRNLLDLPFGPVGRNVTDRAEQVAEIARQNVTAQFQTRTGNLQQSIGTFDVVTNDGEQGVEVGTEGAPYGLILEQGSPAHIITPATQRVLASPPGHPDPLYAPRFRVFHPGGVPRPWLRPALEAVFLGG